jgi:hypothetical protein
VEGFTNDVAFTAAVSWRKNADGTPAETPLQDVKPYPAINPAGVLAVTVNQSTGVVTRWFVPWASLTYLRQDQPAPVAGVAPTTPAPPPAPSQG